MIQIRLQRFVVAVLLLGGGLVAGAAVTTSNEAQGQVRGTPQPQAFQSGGQLSVPVLREIAATLLQIDARLARLETVALRIEATKAANR